ncbi:MAG: hypothetical protein Q8861_05715 [Bacteroidota bacterium]|nr:hypothetical protein [Bacteroidota bacterium]
MRKYIDYAIFWDILFVLIIGTCLSLCKPFLQTIFTLPKIDNLFSFGISLITVGATLLGFLLTIITVIVTFKKGFDDKSEHSTSKNEDDAKGPKINIFDKPVSKEKKFYGTSIHKSVVNVFINSTYEIGLSLIILLIIQFNIICISKFLIAMISLCVFIVLLLSLVRCLYIFKLFLNVHLHE